ncbi:Polymerase/histidinol phosphatase-like protein [Blastocladiella britannica]|nr:Polymerase/histidinol phosphatase-like protein [Blastocladiella britannica]
MTEEHLARPTSILVVPNAPGLVVMTDPTPDSPRASVRSSISANPPRRRGTAISTTTTSSSAAPAAPADTFAMKRDPRSNSSSSFSAPPPSGSTSALVPPLPPSSPQIPTRSAKAALVAWSTGCGCIRALFMTALVLAVAIVCLYKLSPDPYSTTALDLPFQLNASSLGLVPFLDPTFPIASTPNRTILLADLHSHSTQSDGQMSVRDLLRYAMANGLDAIAVTDHNTVQGGLDALDLARTDPVLAGRILVIPGVEYTCCRIHLSLLGITETVAPETSWPSDDDLKAVIAKVHGMGGIVLANHLPWSLEQQPGYNAPRMQRHPTRQQLVEWGIDGFELVNGYRVDTPTQAFEAGRRASNASSKPLLFSGSSDTHTPGPWYVWNAVDVTGGRAVPSSSPTTQRTTVNNVSLAGLNYTHVLDALRARNATPVLFPEGSVFPVPTVIPRPRLIYSFMSPMLALASVATSFLYSDTRGMYSFVGGEWCHAEYVDVDYAAGPFAVVWVGVLALLWFAVRSVAKVVWTRAMYEVRMRRTPSTRGLVIV